MVDIMNKLLSLETETLWKALQHEIKSFKTGLTELDRRVRVFETQGRFDELLAGVLSMQIGGSYADAKEIGARFLASYKKSEQIVHAAAQDLLAVQARDPAAEDLLRPMLFFKGYHAIQIHRLAHVAWDNGERDFALYLQNRTSVALGVDIHPAARLGHGLMMDHATGVVIGETAVIEDDVSILHGVTLGGTGNEQGDRHPKVRRGVMIGAGAKILGNIEIGEGACIAAGSVVLKAVPARVTVAGVPAEIVGRPKVEVPSLAMDQLAGM
jgi:serine O-acetyltransferase